MNILDKIVADKLVEVELRRKLIPIEQLEQSVLFDKTPISLVNNLKSNQAIQELLPNTNAVPLQNRLSIKI